MKRRRQFSELLSSSNNLTFNRYFRLMALSAIELISTVPLATFLIVQSAKNPIYDWRGLADLHYGFSRIENFPWVIWSLNPKAQMSLTITPWLTICCGLIFFIFFGLAEEARTHYRAAITTVAKKLGYTSTPTSSSGYTQGLPPSKGASNSKFWSGRVRSNTTKGRATTLSAPG